MKTRTTIGTRIAAAASLFLLFTTVAHAESRTAEIGGFDAYGTKLKGYVYVPESARTRTAAPLLVVLHGCLQDARGFFTDSGWKEQADRNGFVALLPQQEQVQALSWMASGVWRQGNPVGCFSFADRLKSPLKGGVPEEAAAIASMVEVLRMGKLPGIEVPAIDPQRISLTGLSAGASIGAVLLAEYPTVFSGGALFAGVPALCANSMFSASSKCGITVGDKTYPTKARADGYDRQEWTKFIARAPAPAKRPRVMIVQGMRDDTVDPANGSHMTRQWTSYNGLPFDTPTDGTSALPLPGPAVVVSNYARPGANAPTVTVHFIKELAHAMPIDAGAGCGITSKPGEEKYIADIGYCGAGIAADFLLLK
ncbi:extracellular catalytic domain type 1 short-chain-length polyhydroxyalkanoate depolymerase [Azospirillum sp. sgz301742]